jgi:hypothetical protein
VACALLAAAASASLPALAQGLPSDDTRNFPPTAQFGELTVTNFPEVAINGTPFAPRPAFACSAASAALFLPATMQARRCWWAM